MEANNTGYKYKDKLAISIMALVDDIIGVTNVGYKLELSCAKLKYSLVRVVTADEIEVIVGVQYLSGCVGWVDGVK